MSILRTKRGKAVLGGVLGVLLIGGVALAALLFTSTFSGNSTYADVDVAESSYELAVSGQSTVRGMSCSDVFVAGNKRDVVLNPKITRLVVDGQPASIPVQDCTVAVTIKNIGTANLTVSSFTLSGPGVEGMKVVPQTTKPTVVPGSSGVYRFTLSTTGAEIPKEGAISGALQLTTP